jgi:hypothetical protein
MSSGRIPGGLSALSRSTALMTRPAEVALENPATPGRQAKRRPSRRSGAALVDRAVKVNLRFAPLALRMSLAVVFCFTFVLRQ